jgi:hypothetical protein
MGETTNLKHKFIHRSYLNSSQNTLTAPSPTLESVSNGNQSINFNSDPSQYDLSFWQLHKDGPTEKPV